MDTTNFGTGNLNKLLIQQAIPASLGILILSVYSVIDTMFIGKIIGSIGITAITIVSPITFLVSSLALGIGIGGGALISMKLGGENLASGKKIVGNQISLILLISLVVLVIGFVFFTPILHLFGASETSLAAASSYFFFTLLGLPFFMGQMLLNNLLRTEGHPNLAMVVLGVPAIVNIILDALFIYHWKLGLEGAALATTISQGVGVLLGIVFFVRKSQIFPAIKDLKFEKLYLVEISKLGSIQFFNQATMSIVIVLVNHLLIKHGGELAVSAYGMVLRIVMFAFFPVIGIVQGFMPIAGYNLGAKKHERVKAIVKKSFLSSTVIAVLVTLVALYFKNGIVSMFTNEEALFQLASIAMLWFFMAFPLLGIQSISVSYFQVIGKAKPALLLTLLKQFVLIPSMVVLPIWYGLQGIWYTLPLTEVITTVVAFSYYRYQINR